MRHCPFSSAESLSRSLWYIAPPDRINSALHRSWRGFLWLPALFLGGSHSLPERVCCRCFDWLDQLSRESRRFCGTTGDGLSGWAYAFLCGGPAVPGGEPFRVGGADAGGGSQASVCS